MKMRTQHVAQIERQTRQGSEFKMRRVSHHQTHMRNDSFQHRPGAIGLTQVFRDDLGLFPNISTEFARPFEYGGYGRGGIAEDQPAHDERGGGEDALIGVGGGDVAVAGGGESGGCPVVGGDVLREGTREGTMMRRNE